MKKILRKIIIFLGIIGTIGSVLTMTVGGDVFYRITQDISIFTSIYLIGAIIIIISIPSTIFSLPSLIILDLIDCLKNRSTPYLKIILDIVMIYIYIYTLRAMTFGMDGKKQMDIIMVLAMVYLLLWIWQSWLDMKDK
jgi:hypothetical protein